MEPSDNLPTPNVTPPAGGPPKISRPLFGLVAGASLIWAALLVAWFFMTLGLSLDAKGAAAVYIGVSIFVSALVMMGARMILLALSTQKDVIPPEDRRLLEPLIQSGDEKAIDQYVRLSSLTGSTGLATKLGLTGLPLLTVALTLIFAALELIKPGAGFMDLTKLTLGAFIGSFVQRVATSQQTSNGGRIPPVA